MKNQSELALQQECYTYLHNELPHLRGRLFAVNNNSHNAVKGAFNKAVGVLPGVSDMIYLGDNGQIVFMEFKLIDGRQSQKQEEWQELVESLGYKYVIIRSIEDFLHEIAIK